MPLEINNIGPAPLEIGTRVYVPEMDQEGAIQEIDTYRADDGNDNEYIAFFEYLIRLDDTTLWWGTEDTLEILEGYTPTAQNIKRKPITEFWRKIDA